jgi:hypothetical protein
MLEASAGLAAEALMEQVECWSFDSGWQGGEGFFTGQQGCDLAACGGSKQLWQGAAAMASAITITPTRRSHTLIP